MVSKLRIIWKQTVEEETAEHAAELQTERDVEAIEAEAAKAIEDESGSGVPSMSKLPLQALDDVFTVFISLSGSSEALIRGGRAVEAHLEHELARALFGVGGTADQDDDVKPEMPPETPRPGMPPETPRADMEDAAGGDGAQQYVGKSQSCMVTSGEVPPERETQGERPVERSDDVGGVPSSSVIVEAVHAGVLQTFPDGEVRAHQPAGGVGVGAAEAAAASALGGVHARCLIRGALAAAAHGAPSDHGGPADYGCVAN